MQIFRIGVSVLAGLISLALPSFAQDTASPRQTTTITTLNELQDINNDLSGSYLLANDIDASDTINWNGGEGFVSIGTQGSPFFGHFDGQFHTISNLSINRPGAENQGLFGFVGAGAVVENVRLTDVNVTGGGNTGSLIGVALGASIHTCGASGLLFIRPNGSSDAKSGGLIGSASRGTDVIYCFSAVRVDAGSRLQVGGLIGYLRGVGYPTRLFDSYSSGEVIGNGSKQGNLLGDADGSEVDRCYSSGRFKALIGYNFRDPVITRSYWDSDTGATSSIYGGTPKTTEEMMLQSTYQDWNFATIWEIIDTVTYPGFQSTVPVELMGFTVE